MNRKKLIKSILLNNFIGWTIEIKDNSKDHVGHNNFNGLQESHFQIILENKNLIQKNRIKIHRKINDLLKNEFKNGLHALEIKIL